ncbi:MAG: NAD(P)-dependent oxidoreductase [Spirochaetes bacterium]|nr:NAD(P)-dependent oxidoreductase [Spirochaetota bacterium]
MRLPIPKTEDDLDLLLSRPDEELSNFLGSWKGDILILGIGGKIGVTLGMAAVRASQEAGVSRKIYGVSRFTDQGSLGKLKRIGVETIPCDLLDRKAVERLPEAPNVIYMAGRKFGTEGAEELTWAMNTVVPTYVAERYRESRIVVYSTGCVYDFLSPASGGAVETDPVQPYGDYAQSALGRERVFQYFSRKFHTPVCILRLNYAIDLRYGVLRDIADRVWREEPIPLRVGNFNCIWQGDVIRQTLLSFQYCSSPPRILNITGPETVSVRWVALEFGKRFGKIPRFEGYEGDRMYLSNAGVAASLFGYPRVTLVEMIDLVAEWVAKGGASLGKPTHFEVVDGKF